MTDKKKTKNLRRMKTSRFIFYRLKSKSVILLKIKKLI